MADARDPFERLLHALQREGFPATLETTEALRTTIRSRGGLTRGELEALLGLLLATTERDRVRIAAVVQGKFEAEDQPPTPAIALQSGGVAPAITTRAQQAAAIGKPAWKLGLGRAAMWLLLLGAIAATLVVNGWLPGGSSGTTSGAAGGTAADAGIVAPVERPPEQQRPTPQPAPEIVQPSRARSDSQLLWVMLLGGSLLTFVVRAWGRSPKPAMASRRSVPQRVVAEPFSRAELSAISDQLGVTFGEEEAPLDIAKTVRATASANGYFRPVKGAIQRRATVHFVALTELEPWPRDALEQVVGELQRVQVDVAWVGDGRPGQSGNRGGPGEDDIALFIVDTSKLSDAAQFEELSKKYSRVERWAIIEARARSLWGPEIAEILPREPDVLSRAGLLRVLRQMVHGGASPPWQRRLPASGLISLGEVLPVAAAAAFLEPLSFSALGKLVAEEFPSIDSSSVQAFLALPGVMADPRGVTVEPGLRKRLLRYLAPAGPGSKEALAAWRLRELERFLAATITPGHKWSREEAIAARDHTLLLLDLGNTAGPERARALAESIARLDQLAAVPEFNSLVVTRIRQRTRHESYERALEDAPSDVALRARRMHIIGKQRSWQERLRQILWPTLVRGGTAVAGAAFVLPITTVLFTTAAADRKSGKSCGAERTACGDLCFDLKNDPAHCGTCEAFCGPGVACVDGACGTCDVKARCGAACVDLLSDRQNCGACGAACKADEACKDSKCIKCPLCGQDDKCTDTSSDPLHCGGCNQPCPAENSCQVGKCVRVCALKCASGCVTAETLKNDPANCGACEHACARDETQTGQCLNGLCVQCRPGMRDCDHNLVNGCETEVDVDVDNCGVCGKACSPGVNAAPACVNGKCGAGRCLDGTADCDGKSGCETVIRSDVANCGACGNTCPPCANGTAQCANGTCACSCAVNATLCGSTCVQTTDDTANCGACGRRCAECRGGTASCSGGLCGCNCPYGTTRCGNACVALDFNDQNCGACNVQCRGEAKCAGRQCVCPDGGDWLLCDNTCVQKERDSENCGACGNRCEDATRIYGCVAGACKSFECRPGLYDCDGAGACESSTPCEPPRKTTAPTEKKGGCFPAGTLVDTPTGKQFIERLNPGDLVTAVDSMGRRQSTHVVAVLQTTSPLLTLSTTAGALITTPDHPLALQVDLFRQASEIRLGSTLQFWNGARAAGVLVTSKPAPGPTQIVYNLEVEEPHTFIASGFVVHNKLIVQP